MVDDRSNIPVTSVVLVVVSFKPSSEVPERTVGSQTTSPSSFLGKEVDCLETVLDRVAQLMLSVVRVG